jgi:hypothetical protein
MEFKESSLDGLSAAKIKAKIEKAYKKLEAVKEKTKKGKKAKLKQLVELRTIEGLIEYLKEK